MAWYYGTYSCGHDGKINLVGPTKDRQQKADWHFSGLCPDCYRKKQEEDREAADIEAEKKSEEMELPRLIGTEKQRKWANQLRLKVISSLNSNCEKIEQKLKERGLDVLPGEGIGMKEIIDSVQYFIRVHTDAKDWIDSRDEPANLKDAVNEYRKHLEEIAHYDVIEEINRTEESMIVSPECDFSKNGVVKLRFKDGFLDVEYVKDSAFIEIVKNLGYRWSGTVWKKEITEYTGDIEDRADELGYRLLNAGFTVQFPDAESKEKAVSAAFTPENDKWIKFNSKTGQLTLVWTKRNDTIYENAKKLPGAKWKDGAMRVSMEFYREIEDFSVMMGFCISQMARRKIEEYKEKEQSFEKVLTKTAESANT